MILIKNLAIESITQPITKFVSGNSEAYLASTGSTKLGWRSFRRKIAIALMRQNKSYFEKIHPTWKKGIFIYEGIPQIGDALMDLAPRSLFAQTGVTIDLVTHKNISTLFQNDPWFNKTYSFDDFNFSNKYDFAIVMAHKQRTLKFKKLHFFKTPWISIHKYFTGPEFQRAELSTQRFIDLFKLNIESNDFNKHSHQKLKPIQSIMPKPSFSRKNIGIVVGGLDKKRVYSHWISVIKNLSHFNISISLLGSSNGVLDANFIKKSITNININNEVDKLSLEECRKTIEDLDLILCCDGGLMHLSLTTKTPVVGLFNALVQPEWRLPKSNQCICIQSTTDFVNHIQPEIISKKIIEIMNY